MKSIALLGCLLSFAGLQAQPPTGPLPINNVPSAIPSHQVNQSLNSIYNNFGTVGDGSAYIKAAGTNFGSRPDLKGSQFVFTQWVKGRIINNKDIVYSEGYFNFDKVNQQLLLLDADQKLLVVDKEPLKSIYLTDGASSYTMEKIPSMHNNLFYKAIVKGPKYSLYCYIETTFVPSSSKTNGLTSSGVGYDEYKDQYTYYIVTKDWNALKVSLKKKSIRNVLDFEKTKVEEYFGKNDKTIDEEYLVGLLDYLNQ